MQGTQHDLLREPWIGTVDDEGRRRKLDLAQVLEYLSAGRELEFTGLRSHQQQAWYAFLVQLAAMALDRDETYTPEQDAEEWRRMIEQLEPDHPTAFYLIVDDLAKPAFFQPPAPEGTLAKWKNSSSTPELLDIRITAKNFDVKADGFTGGPDVEHWAFALVTLQTMEGFLGRGNYGISRMNGGFASRSEVGLAENLGWASRFRRDVFLLLEIYDDILGADFGFPQDGGLTLLWCDEWQGEAGEALLVSDLDPYFLEVCRRVRLTRESNRTLVRMAPTKASRVEAKMANGYLGDPWTPVRKDKAALTVSDGGFHYRLVHALLFPGDYRKSAALEPREGEDGAMLATFRVLARGQGKTGGYHERQIRVPAKIGRRMHTEEGLAALANASAARITSASEAQNKVLKTALLVLVQEHPGREEGTRLDFDDQRPRPFVLKLDREINRTFFEELFRDLEQETDAARLGARWHEHLYGSSKQIFDRALETLCPPGDRRFRARSKAEAVFRGSAKKHLPLAPSLAKKKEKADPA